MGEHVQEARRQATFLGEVGSGACLMPPRIGQSSALSGSATVLEEGSEAVQNQGSMKVRNRDLLVARNRINDHEAMALSCSNSVAELRYGETVCGRERQQGCAAWYCHVKMVQMTAFHAPTISAPWKRWKMSFKLAPEMAKTSNPYSARAATTACSFIAGRGEPVLRRHRWTAGPSVRPRKAAANRRRSSP